MASGRPEKHSLTLSGHRTSVSLEPEFWRAFRELAGVEGRGINELAAEIDAGRPAGQGLASAIRVWVLERARSRIRESGDLIERKGRNLPR
jgi:predicted DNA-binding ribbon-helix-helix protein